VACLEPEKVSFPFLSSRLKRHFQAILMPVTVQLPQQIPARADARNPGLVDKAWRNDNEHNAIGALDNNEPVEP
jgi:hypothetical protein